MGKVLAMLSDCTSNRGRKEIVMKIVPLVADARLGASWADVH